MATYLKKATSPTSELKSDVATTVGAKAPYIVACKPPRGDSINPTVAHALSLAGVDVIMAK